MKPVRLPAAATLALPRWALIGLGLLYILPGLIGRDPWKDDAGSFGVMWTMAHGGLNDWLLPNIAGLPSAGEGPLAFWLGALGIKLFGWFIGDLGGARVSTAAFFLLGVSSLWFTAFHLGRRAEAQPLRLAFGGQPEPTDYGRTLADTAVLIYIGCLGLLLQSHETLAVTVQGALLSYFMYRAVRYVELPSVRNAGLIGLSLGLLTLTRGWLCPAGAVIALVGCARYLDMPMRQTLRHMAIAVLAGLLITLVWVVPAEIVQPWGRSPVAMWLAWNASQIGLPSAASLTTLLRTGLWFSWPAWPFAFWAIYAWRRQSRLLHIVLPLFLLAALGLLVLFNPEPENGDLLKLLAPLALMAAFGLPTMKRGTINAIDWFSVMVLTMIAGLIWMFYIAKLTGWPAQLAKNVLKLVPGFQPQFGLGAFIVAAAVTVSWFFLVHWRISRRPSVLWRAVVLSSGGLILLWVLLMTLFLPDLNYGKSYEIVAHQIADKLPDGVDCIETNVGPAQRASFAYFGHLPFAGLEQKHCSVVLIQDSVNVRDTRELDKRFRDSSLSLLWEGRRPSDRNERFRLYRRGE
ncbi:glycosyltransferase [Massilia arenosa]|uniref:Glycosyltransferase n=1 Tax=Zemynaea arenosa TaxID=2561931 RepID=A0A4Y9S4L5_9BURK|nr:glycosyltransferase [Massilia arenosa]TFW15431.1 glycosyltransferase [Massilia arenosa]